MICSGFCLHLPNNHPLARNQEGLRNISTTNPNRVISEYLLTLQSEKVTNYFDEGTRIYTIGLFSSINSECAEVHAQPIMKHLWAGDNADNAGVSVSARLEDLHCH